MGESKFPKCPIKFQDPDGEICSGHVTEELSERRVETRSLKRA